jgi:hypothetical protein
VGADRIEHFLAQMSQEGVRDSEGAFTVSGERALKKLAFSQLPRPSAWVLKVIQAGVAGGADSISVRQLGRSLQFKLQGADFGSLEQVLEAWTSLSSGATEAQNNLAVGLRAVCFALQRPCILVYQDHDYGYRAVMWDGAHVSRVLSATELVKKGVPLSWVGSGGWAICVFNSRSKRIRAEEFDELSRYGVTSPVPLYVDGREMNHFGIKDVSRTRRSVMFSAQTIKEGDLPTRNGIRLPANLGQGQSVRLAWVLYSDEEPQASRLSWVRGGVVVQEQTLALSHHGLFFRIFVSAEGLPTDLTTLIPRFPEPHSQEKWSRLAILQLKDDLREDRDLARQICVELSKETERNWSTVGLAILGGLLATPFTKGASMFMTTAFIASDYKSTQQKASREGQRKLAGLLAAVDAFVRREF